MFACRPVLLIAGAIHELGRKGAVGDFDFDQPAGSERVGIVHHDIESWFETTTRRAQIFFVRVRVSVSLRAQLFAADSFRAIAWPCSLIVVLSP